MTRAAGWRPPGPGKPLVMAFLYRRVSSADQARHGQSLEVQRQHTRLYALRRGWRVCGEFEEVASGAHVDRPGYQALLASVRRAREDGRAAAVVVAWLDRFGRSVAERARATGELRALGVELHSVMEGGAIPGLVGSLLAVVAEQERNHLVRRIQVACAEAVRAGWYCTPQAPWGYRLRPATPAERRLGARRSVLADDPAAAPAVREAFMRAAAGCTIASIARWDPGAARRGTSWTPIRRRHRQLDAARARLRGTAPTG